MAGDMFGIKITYSTPNAEDMVPYLARIFGLEFLLGMGTLTLPKYILSVKEAGATFTASPDCEPNCGNNMINSGLLPMAGIYARTEVLQTSKLDADVIKTFPGSLVGLA